MRGTTKASMPRWCVPLERVLSAFAATRLSPPLDAIITVISCDRTVPHWISEENTMGFGRFHSHGAITLGG